MPPVTPNRKAIMGPPPLPSPSTPSSSSSGSSALVLRTPPSAMQVDVKPLLPNTPTSPAKALVRSPRRRSSATPGSIRSRAMTTTPTSASAIRARLASLAPRPSPRSTQIPPSATSSGFTARCGSKPVVIEDDDDDDDEEQTAFWQPSGSGSKLLSRPGGSSDQPISLDSDDDEQLPPLFRTSSHSNATAKEAEHRLIPSSRDGESEHDFNENRFNRAGTQFSEASIGSAGDFRREDTMHDFDPRYGRYVPRTSSGSRQAREDQPAQPQSASIPRGLNEAIARLGSTIKSLTTKQTLVEKDEGDNDQGGKVNMEDVITEVKKTKLVVTAFFEEDMTEGRQLLQSSLSPSTISRFLSMVETTTINCLTAYLEDYKSSGRVTKSVRQAQWFGTLLAFLQITGGQLKTDLQRDEVEALLYALRKTIEDARAQAIIQTLSTKIVGVDITVFRKLIDHIRELSIEIVGLVWSS
ncbi:hypothetical protein I316_04175 [Kwoniella heveanensis BCC8398]|uniref:Uncharacterized protein n=1 Tax=Kwoniella heveanensis BCC8398 TaxID=1296120 RepID=A0A1B9GT27_9TREE|nr:hypothetical protein I316_04175 [Kwoniella heveanensis BCC8398]